MLFPPGSILMTLAMCDACSDSPLYFLGLPFVHSYCGQYWVPVVTEVRGQTSSVRHQTILALTIQVTPNIITPIVMGTGQHTTSRPAIKKTSATSTCLHLPLMGCLNQSEMPYSSEIITGEVDLASMP